MVDVFVVERSKVKGRKSKDKGQKTLDLSL